MPDVDTDSKRLENMHTLMSEDYPRRSRTVICDVQNPQEIEELFDTITYQKGNNLFKSMAENILKSLNLIKFN